MSNISIDQQFVEYVVKAIVSNQDAVSVERSVDEKGVLLELTVDPEDLGRVIGKRGATAQSIRTLLRALGTKNDARYNLKIVDNGVPRSDNTASSDNSTSDDVSATEDVVEKEVDKVVEKSAAPEATDNEESSSSASKTRKELEDLDDLDI